jgi:hypothetical protein
MKSNVSNMRSTAASLLRNVTSPQPLVVGSTLQHNKMT